MQPTSGVNMASGINKSPSFDLLHSSLPDKEEQFSTEKTMSKESGNRDLLTINERKIFPVVKCVFQHEVVMAPVMQRGLDYFYHNLERIFSQEKILSGCGPFKLPVLSGQGEFNKIKTVLCIDNITFESKLNGLGKDELGFIILKEASVRGYFSLNFSLNSNQGKSENRRKIKAIMDGCLNSNPEFFRISFTLFFDEQKRLLQVLPSREVNLKYRRKGICKIVSLNALSSIYKHLGNSSSMIDCISTLHIGTVKFHYPLNSFFNMTTGRHLRDVNFRKEELHIEDCECRAEPLEVFEDRGSLKRCPHDEVNLENLLLQYEFRRIFEEQMPPYT